MTEPPLNHTSVHWAHAVSDGTAFMSGSYTFYYTDCDDPLLLPDPALCDETIDEWAAYKKWEIDQIVQYAKREIVRNKAGRIPWRRRRIQKGANGGDFGVA